MTTKEEAGIALVMVEGTMDGLRKVGVIPAAAFLERAVAILRSRLAELEALVPRWIPVAEKLPEAEGYYLAIVNEKPKRLVVRWEAGEWRVGKSSRVPVTRWCELPPPPVTRNVESISPEDHDR